MLTTQEIRALCDVAGVTLYTEHNEQDFGWYALIRGKTQALFDAFSMVSEDEAIHAVWGKYVNSQRD